MISLSEYKHTKFLYVGKQLLLVLGITQVLRLIFYIYLRNYLSVTSLFEYLNIVLHSLRFDLSSIISVNLPYIALSLLPFSFMAKQWVQQVLRLLFVITNSLAFLFDIADIAYFPYVRKRMTADVFQLIGNKSDFVDLLPSYLTKFWYVPVLLLLFIFLFAFLSNKINKPQYIKPRLKTYIAYIVTLAVCFLAVRGGVQLRPITLSNAVIPSVKNQNIPLVINTPFSILKTFETSQLKELHYMDNKQMYAHFNPIKNHKSTKPFRNQNVVVIILESFGKSFTGIGGRKSCTPFLDSLMQNACTYTNAYANACRSADGIPAVISSMPYMMNDAFPISSYSTNSIDAFPSLLKKKGYVSSFFHGGTNGTMNFDTYCKSAGFDNYYGRTEYNNDKNYDGTWGIWDEPFLQFFADKLSEQKQPFFSTIFTLSSHEPFKIPEQYNKSSFAKLKGIERGIAYSDMALKKFFAKASKQKWFANTLFVITADHNYLAYNDPLKYYNQGMGLFAIPVIFYQANNPSLRGYDSTLMQQINILPTVMDYLHFDKPFFSFGKSVLNYSDNDFCFTCVDNKFYMYFPPKLLFANDENVAGYYDFKEDSMLANNQIAQKDSLFFLYEKKYHAYQQLLRYSLINNKQSVETFYKK